MSVALRDKETPQDGKDMYQTFGFSYRLPPNLLITCFLFSRTHIYVFCLNRTLVFETTH